MTVFKRHSRSTRVACIPPVLRKWDASDPVFTDVHCHCLPGLDDGPADTPEALALCRVLVADGVRTVVATPHQLGRYEGRNGGAQIRQAAEHLEQALAEVQIPLTVHAGADVRIDERIPELLESNEVLAVGDVGCYLLLELPHDVFIDPHALIAGLAERGVVTVITHPERHPFLARNPDYVQRWVEYHPCLQITAASFGGGFGPLSQEAAWAFLCEPLPVLVATDAHDTTSRPPRMTEAYTLLSQRLGRSAARTLCVENPQRILSGQDVLMLTREGIQGVIRR
jgi:protein-tyrosine phosphatase